MEMTSLPVGNGWGWRMCPWYQSNHWIVLKSCDPAPLAPLVSPYLDIWLPYCLFAGQWGTFSRRRLKPWRSLNLQTSSVCMEYALMREVRGVHTGAPGRAGSNSLVLHIVFHSAHLPPNTVYAPPMLPVEGMQFAIPGFSPFWSLPVGQSWSRMSLKLATGVEAL